MIIDPESTQDLRSQYKLARRKNDSADSTAKLQKLVTQAKDPRTEGCAEPQRKKWGWCGLVRSMFVCFRRRYRVYDLNPPTAACLLPPQPPHLLGRKTLVLDLDETLVHSTFEPTSDCDLTVKVTIEGGTYLVYVKTRPGLSEFLEEVAKMYEVVVFTASLSKYADPVLDMLDPAGYVAHRLFREHCVLHNGAFVKDLGRLGRDINNVAIVDNSAASYLFHPDNAIPIRSFFDDDSDRELLSLIPLLKEMGEAEDVTTFLNPYRRNLSERATVDLSQMADRLECNSPRAV